MLRGTGVSEGCGIGKALIIQHRSLDYSGVVFGGAQQEKSGFGQPLTHLCKRRSSCEIVCKPLPERKRQRF